MDDAGQGVQHSIPTSPGTRSPLAVLDAARAAHARVLLVEFRAWRCHLGFWRCQPSLGLAGLRIWLVGGRHLDDALSLATPHQRPTRPLDQGPRRRAPVRDGPKSNRIVLQPSCTGLDASVHLLLCLRSSSLPNPKARFGPTSLGRAHFGNPPLAHHRRLPACRTAPRTGWTGRIGCWVVSQGEPLRKVRVGCRPWNAAPRSVH